MDDLKNETPEQQEARLQRETDAKALRIERAREKARQIVRKEQCPPSGIPPFERLDVRLARPKLPEVWRVHSVMQKGHLVVFAAQAKAGKTTSAINLARSLVDGVRLFGNFTVEPVDHLLVMDFEMAEPSVRCQLDDWYEQAGLQHPEKVTVVPMRGRSSAFNIVDPDIRAEWAARIKETGADFVIWDCLSTVVTALGLDPNTEVQGLLVAFGQLLALAGIREAIVIHHMGHSNERAKGDSGILAWPDALWAIVRGDPDKGGDYNTRFFKAEGRGINIEEQELAFDKGTGLLTVVGGSRANAKLRAAGLAIVEALRDGPKSSGELEIAVDAAGITRAPFRKALVKGTGCGAWSEAKQGKAKIYTLLDETKLAVWAPRHIGDIV
jgi:hypothetical protein